MNDREVPKFLEEADAATTAKLRVFDACLAAARKYHHARAVARQASADEEAARVEMVNSLVAAGIEVPHAF